MYSNMTTEQVHRRPCQVISLREKLAILQQLESGISRREIKKTFNCSQSSISRILMNKERIMEEARNGVIRENLTIKHHAYRDLYEALTKWAKEMKEKDGVITTQIARNKAEELSHNMGRELIPSKAWLYKWKDREGIVFARKIKEPEQNVQDCQEKQNEQSSQLTNLSTEFNHRLEIVHEGADLHITDNGKYFTAKNLNDSRKNCNKPKRKYTNRLTTIDDSGMICRNRKERTYLTMLQKLEVVQRLKNGERKSDLGLEYNLSQLALTQVVNDEEKMLELAPKGQNLQMKIVRRGKFCKGEIELNKWVHLQMDKGESLTRTQVINQAKEIAERLNINFKASNGWVKKWKARMNMEFNENQILYRKIPSYIENEISGDSNPHKHKVQADAAYDHFECEVKKPEVEVYSYEAQQFYLRNIHNDPLAEKGFGKFDKEQHELEECDISTPPPLDCTPPTVNILRDSCETSKHQSLEQNEKLTEQVGEDLDINPVISFDPLEELLANTEDSFEHRIYSWLQRYNIENSAAKELLDILKTHLGDESVNQLNHMIDQRNLNVIFVDKLDIEKLFFP